MRTVAAFLRSLVFTPLFYLGSVPIVAAAVVASRLSPPLAIPMARLWAGWFAVTTRVILGIRCKVVGTVPQSAVIAAFKHQAAYETIMVLRLFDRPAVVMKAELLDIPLWSTAAVAHGIIPVDRAESASALRRMLKAAAAARTAGRPVVIFPEGTRTPVGTAPALRAGLAGLYRSLKVPLVPVAVDSGRCWPKGFVKYPGTVTFDFGATIPAGLERSDIEARVHHAINALNPA